MSGVDINSILNSSQKAHEYWYDYNYNNNSKGLSKTDYDLIVEKYRPKINKWKAEVTKTGKDQNDYVIDNDEGDAKKSHVEQATGGASKGKMYTRSAADGAMALGGMLSKPLANGIFKVGAKFKALSNANARAEFEENMYGGVSEETRQAQEVAQNNYDKASENSKKADFIIAATLAFATGLRYKLEKPNEDGKEVCDYLMDTELPTAMSNLKDTQFGMEESKAEINELVEKIQKEQEETQKYIENENGKISTTKGSYDTLKQKLESGEEMSEAEKGQMKSMLASMQQNSANISTKKEDSAGKVEDMTGEVEDNKAVIEDASETINNVTELTEYAEDMGKATRTNCIIEAVGQGINVASGTKAAIKAGKFAASGAFATAWAWAFVGLGTAGAVMSGIGVVEQAKWAKGAGDMLDSNEIAQNETESVDFLRETHIEEVDESLDELEESVPEDIEIVEVTDTVESLGLDVGKDDEEIIEIEEEETA